MVVNVTSIENPLRVREWLASVKSIIFALTDRVAGGSVEHKWMLNVKRDDDAELLNAESL